jgi:hypothetical protein
MWLAVQNYYSTNTFSFVLISAQANKDMNILGAWLDSTKMEIARTSQVTSNPGY